MSRNPLLPIYWWLRRRAKAASHFINAQDVVRDVSHRTESNLRSSIDANKSNAAEHSGIMVGKIEFQSLTLDEESKLFASMSPSLGGDRDSGFALISSCTGISSAFLAAQSTPTMAHLAGYLWVRIVLEAIIKSSGTWDEVKALGYDNMGQVMLACSTPVVLGGLGLFDDVTSTGASTPDKLAAVAASALLSANRETQNEMHWRLLGATSSPMVIEPLKLEI